MLIFHNVMETLKKGKPRYTYEAIEESLSKLQSCIKITYKQEEHRLSCHESLLGLSRDKN